MGEFELIRRFFQQEQAEHPPEGVFMGVGDDAALLEVPPYQQLAVSVDTLVSGVHFPADADAEDIAQRALRVNLSDLAAMGAQPLWFTLALTLPNVDESWLRDFSRGLFAVANQYGCALVGGDTTSGPLSITVQVMGVVEAGHALRRDGASVGDYILVTHHLGDGAAGLAAVEGRLKLDAEQDEYLRQRFYRPEPRVAEARKIRDLASAALDISDGLVADLGHICAASDLGAEVYVEDLPLSPVLAGLEDRDQALNWALSGGDDYELCFTVPEEHMAEVGLLIAQGELQATVIGHMVAGASVQCLHHGQTFELDQPGYNHFHD
ncbi:thiamine-phosphate kinase [Marinimicrobium sp. ABcell2]|uniref:thiamine-phosphate kinase n=1 Tax=Marinimicrobium sp. ABcell2 TaxID=3069751 RepID=UPI0027AEB6A6|nr:thiamine-phosphate kinase [Marinimicrobium sp. ABcell2]MDQ2075789.1 thiamine-phosphate kinase [Marinimicrobium sp. ABcell2]